MIVVLTMAFLNSALSIFMGRFTTFAVRADFSNLLKYGSLTVVVLVLSYLSELFKNRWKSKYLRKVILGLKEDYYKKLLLFSNKDSYTLNSSEQFNLVDSNMELIRTNYFDNMLEIASHIVNISICTLALININKKLCLLLFLISFIPIILNPKIKKGLGKKKEAMISSKVEQTSKLNDFLNGLFTTRINGSGKFFYRKINNAELNYELAKEANDVSDKNVVLTVKTVNMISQIVCMIFIAYYISIGELQVGEIITATQLLNFIFPSINIINSKYTQLNSSKVLIEQMDKVFQTEEKAANIKFEYGDIKAENLSLNFGDSEILHKMNVVISQNSRVLIIGKSGSGKSSILKILMGVNDKYDGIITINNQNLKLIEENDFNNNVTYLQQKPYIYNEDLLTNLTLGKDYPQKKIDEVIERCSLSHLKHYTQIDDKKVSGGEISRIGIARALLSDKKIMIFDEPTASLDPENTEIINNIIFDLKDKIIIVISHIWEERFKNKFDQVIYLKGHK